MASAQDKNHANFFLPISDDLGLRSPFIQKKNQTKTATSIVACVKNTHIPKSPYRPTSTQTKRASLPTGPPPPQACLKFPGPASAPSTALKIFALAYPNLMVMLRSNSFLNRTVCKGEHQPHHQHHDRICHKSRRAGGGGEGGSRGGAVEGKQGLGDKGSLFTPGSVI